MKAWNSIFPYMERSGTGAGIRFSGTGSSDESYTARTTLSKALPSENIQVSQSGASIVLTGDVAHGDAEQAGAIAKTEKGNVISLLTTPPMNQVIMLEVKFAEVDRNAIQELGINIFSTGALNTMGAISTGQYSAISASDGTGKFN